MKYSIIATKRFEKDFKRLGVEQRRRVDRAIRDMGQNPYAGKRLKGELAGKWSLKIGDYRVIYLVDERKKVVILLTLRPRRSAYK